MDNTLRLWDLKSLDPAATSVVLSRLEHDTAISSLRITPDSRWLLAASSEDIRLWDLSAKGPASASGDLLGLHETQDCPNIRRIEVSSDSRWAVVSTCWCTRLFRLAGKEPWSAPLLLHRSDATTTTSPDGAWVATWNDANELLWRLPSSDQELERPDRLSPDSEEPVVFAAVTPDSDSLLTLTVGNTPVRWNLTGGEPQGERTEWGTRADWQSTDNVQISADGRWLVAESRDEIRLWALGKGKDRQNTPIVLASQMATDPVSPGTASRESARTKVTISPNGRWLVSTGGPSPTLLDLHRLPTGSLDGQEKLTRYLLAENIARGQAAVFSPNGRWLLINSADACVLYALGGDGRDGKVVPNILEGVSRDDCCVAFDSSENWLAITGDNRNVQLRKLVSSDSLSAPVVLAGHARTVESLVFTAEGKRLITWDGWTARIWNVTGNDQVTPTHSLRGHFSADAHLVARSADGSRLATASKTTDEANLLEIWNMAGHVERAWPAKQQGEEEAISALAINTKGDLVATGGRRGQVRLWDLHRPRAEDACTILGKHDDDVTALALSRDGRWLITGSLDGQVCLWDLQSRKLVATLREHTEGIRSLAVSPNGHWLLTASFDNRILLWDLRSNERFSTPRFFVWNAAPTPGATPFTRSDDDLVNDKDIDPVSSLWDEALRGFHDRTRTLTPAQPPSVEPEVGTPIDSVPSPGLTGFAPPPPRLNHQRPGKPLLSTNEFQKLRGTR